jgi:hypothetical protein
MQSATPTSQPPTNRSTNYLHPIQSINIQSINQSINLTNYQTSNTILSTTQGKLTKSTIIQPTIQSLNQRTNIEPIDQSMKLITNQGQSKPNNQPNDQTINQ